VPFHAILARENSARHPMTLVPDDINDSTALWACREGYHSCRSTFWRRERTSQKTLGSVPALNALRPPERSP
jgi:hypothetical protein